MYTSEIIKYLLWPAIILVSWLIIRYTVDRYEKNQIKEEGQNSAPGE
jgi:hypothetical protein